MKPITQFNGYATSTPFESYTLQAIRQRTTEGNVRNLAKSHKVGRIAHKVFNAEQKALRVAYLERVGTRKQERADKYKAARKKRKEEKNNRI